MRTIVLTVLAMGATGALLGGCETISQDACVAGDWEGIGFRDGANGQSRARLVDISKGCAKYNIQPDRSAYLRGLEDGLQRYCTPETGYRKGRDGSGINNECSVRGFDTYVDAHAEGLLEYAIERDYRDLIDAWKKTDVALANVTGRLTDETLSIEERERLRRKRNRLEARAEELRIDIRVVERTEGYPRWTPAS